jgi:membrane protease subunit (stomatin/prohibitin family)
MATPSRMPRYDVRNDGAGPYGVFHCDKCSREFRSQPDIGNTIAKDIGRQAMGGFLRNIPIVGGAVADNVTGQDPRYVRTLNQQQLDAAWGQVKQNFRECPTCKQVVCLSDFDEQSGFCNEHSPRRNQIAESQADQAGAMLKGLAGAFGITGAVQQAADAAKRVTSTATRCPKDGTLAAPGTKFCPNCGTAMIQPAADACPKCGAETHGAKFCPNCGTTLERASAVSTVCPSCGTDAKGAKFCPNCGTKLT